MNSQRKDSSTCADGAAPGTNGGRSRRVRRCRFGTKLSQNSTSWHRPLLLIAAVLLLGCDVEGFSDTTRPSRTGGLKIPSSASSAISAGPRCFSSSARLLPAHSMLFASSVDPRPGVRYLPSELSPSGDHAPPSAKLVRARCAQGSRKVRARSLPWAPLGFGPPLWTPRTKAQLALGSAYLTFH